jgi:hypothetical protein
MPLKRYGKTKAAISLEKQSDYVPPRHDGKCICNPMQRTPRRIHIEIVKLMYRSIRCPPTPVAGAGLPEFGDKIRNWNRSLVHTAPSIPPQWRQSTSKSPAFQSSELFLSQRVSRYWFGWISRAFPAGLRTTTINAVIDVR